MCKLLVILLLFWPLDFLEAQTLENRRYNINTADTQEATGSVTITDQYIHIYQDSMVTTLPIVDTGTHRSSTYFILEGCYYGTAFRGAGMFTPSSRQSLSGGHYRYFFALYIEMRARQKYQSIKYSLYYDE